MFLCLRFLAVFSVFLCCSAVNGAQIDFSSVECPVLDNFSFQLSDSQPVCIDSGVIKYYKDLTTTSVNYTTWKYNESYIIIDIKAVNSMCNGEYISKITIESDNGQVTVINNPTQVPWWIPGNYRNFKKETHNNNLTAEQYYWEEKNEIIG